MPWPRRRSEAIEALISAAMTRLGIPGLSAAVVTERRLRWSSAYGTADLENFVPAKNETVYRLASVTKPITATAVLQLVEAGKVDLDAPIQRYVPAFPAKQWPVTVRHLLSHQSGIRNWTDEEFHNTRHFANIAESLAVFKDDPLLFEPGHAHAVHEPRLQPDGRGGRGRLGQAVPRVPPRARVRARGDGGRARRRRPGHHPQPRRRLSDDAGGELRNSPMSDTSNRTAGGGLVATAEDVARFAIAFQRGTLLKPSTAQAAFGRQRTRDRRITGYGLGWIVGDDGGRREVYHTGGQPRVSTVLYMVPRSGVAVVLLCNLEGVSTPLLDLARQVADTLLR